MRKSALRLADSGEPITRVPARLAWSGDRCQVVMGSAGSYGDAGWGVFEFASPELASEFVARHPQASLPCWRRFEVQP